MTQRSFQRANNKDHEQHGRPPQAAARQPSPARASLAAVTRRAGRVIGLTPPRLPTTVGESPFVQSVAGSSIQSPADGAAAANGAVGVYGNVNVDATNTGAEIVQNMICDFDARGDNEDSDEEGDEATLHRSDVGVAETGPPALDRDDPGEELTSHPNAAIPGAPPGWLPPQPPTDHVYVPKFDVVAVKEVAATATKKAFMKTIVSFQSTGATNIAGVDSQLLP